MKRICAAVALAALFQFQNAHAECRKIVPADYDNWLGMEDPVPGVIDYNAEHVVTFGSGLIDVESTLPVNATIATGESAPTGHTYILRCDDNVGTNRFELTPDNGADIQPSGVDGIGYRVFYKRASGTSTQFPYINYWTADRTEYPAIPAGNTFVIELVKTGPMQSVSTLNLGQVARIAGGGDGVTALKVLASPVTLRVLPHCQVTGDKPLLVDFGQFGPSEVSAISGPTQPVTINVACDGPTPPNTVSATLAAQPDPIVSDFIKNGGTASGLAIRLRDAATQAVLKPQIPTSVLTQSSPGYNTAFNLEASVLRVGAAAAVPGTIDAQAVVTLTFL